jgi:Na+/proline symporter
MSPVMVAALFWKRSTKWGALAATVFVAAFLVWTAAMQYSHKAGDVLWQIGADQGAIKVFFLNPTGDVAFCDGYMTVVPMVLGSALVMAIFSLVTPPPGRATIEKYFGAAPA